MSRHYVVHGEPLIVALAGRVDRLDHAHTALTGEVTALRAGVADLTTELRRRPAPGKTGPNDDEQPDWVTVTNIETARVWLADVDRGRRDVLPRHGLTVTTPCWALHPDVVAALTALLVERAAAYAGDRPTAVTEWVTRWLPAITTRVEHALAGCVSERAHRDNGHTYRVGDLDLMSVAAWWATDRHIPAPEAFALTPLR